MSKSRFSYQHDDYVQGVALADVPKSRGVPTSTERRDDLIAWLARRIDQLELKVAELERDYGSVTDQECQR